MKIITILLLLLSFHGIAQQTRIKSNSRRSYTQTGAVLQDTGFSIYNANNYSDIPDTSYGVNPQTFQVTSRTYTVKTGAKNHSKISQTWNTTTNQWTNYLKRESLFDNLGLLTSTITYDWVGNAFVPSTKDSSNYKPAGEYLSTYNFYYDNIAGKWNVSYRSMNHYNMSGMVDSLVGAYFVNFQWRDTIRMLFNNVSAQYATGFYLAKNGLAWDTTTRYFRRFDNQKHLLLDSLQTWNGPGDWTAYFSYSHRYDANGNKILDSSQTGTSIFNYNHENFRKTTYEYNNNNQLTRELYYIWDKTLNAWQLKYVGPSQSSYDYRLYYDTYNNVAEVKSLPALVIYPNPAHDYLNVSMDMKPGNTSFVSIQSINGDLYYSNITDNSLQTINIQHLPAGVYILSVKAKEGFQSKTFVIN